MSPLPANSLPFGMRDIKLKPYSAAGVLGAAVDLPASRTLSWADTEDFEQLRGDDVTQASHGSGPQVNWEIESGGVPLQAIVIIAGGAVADSGVTPNQKRRFTKKGTSSRPYFWAEGQAINDGPGDTHVILPRLKAEGDIEWEFSDGSFTLTNASGIGIPDANDDLYIIEFNESVTPIVAP